MTVINYYTVRFFATTIFLGTILLVYTLLVKNKTKTKYVIYLIAIFMSLVFGQFLPFEKYITFNTPEKLFKYYHPLGKIEQKYIYDNYAFLVVSNINSENERIVSFVNWNNKWKFDRMQKDNYNKPLGIYQERNGKEELIELASVCINNIPEENVTAVSVWYRLDNNEELMLTDSLNSKFDIKKQDKSNIFVKRYEFIHTTIIEKNLYSEYKIYLNDKEFLLIK